MHASRCRYGWNAEDKEVGCYRCRRCFANMSAFYIFNSAFISFIVLFFNIEFLLVFTIFTLLYALCSTLVTLFSKMRLINKADWIRFRQKHAIASCFLWGFSR